MLSDWFKNLTPSPRQKRSKSKTNCDLLTHFFSRASRLPHIFALSFDWFTGLSMSFVCMFKVITLVFWNSAWGIRTRMALSQEEPNMRRSESCLCRIDFTYSVVGFWLVSAFRIMLCLTALHCFFQEHKSAKTVGEMKQYVQKIPFMQRAKASLATRE